MEITVGSLVVVKDHVGTVEQLLGGPVAAKGSEHEGAFALVRFADGGRQVVTRDDVRPAVACTGHHCEANCDYDPNEIA